MLCSAAKVVFFFVFFFSHWDGYLIARQRFLEWEHGGGKCPWIQGMNPGATGDWGLRRYYRHTMAATDLGCPSWSLSVGTGPGEMLVQANHS